jgi:hypothetical protein
MTPTVSIKSKILPRKKRTSIPVQNPVANAETTYNPAFVAKILESQSQIENGQYRVIKTDDLWK